MFDAKNVPPQPPASAHACSLESIPEYMRAWPEWQELFAIPEDQRLAAMYRWLQTRHKRRNTVVSEILLRLGAMVMRSLILEAVTARRAKYQSRLLAIVERMDAPLTADDVFDLVSAARRGKNEAVRDQILQIIKKGRSCRTGSH